MTVVNGEEFSTCPFRFDSHLRQLTDFFVIFLSNRTLADCVRPVRSSITIFYFVGY